MIGKETKHVMHFRSMKLRPDEAVVATMQGYIGSVMGSGANAQRNGNFIVTNQRVLFYRKGVFGEVLRAIPTESITSIEVTSSWGYRSIIVYTAHDELTFTSLDGNSLFDSVYAIIEDYRGDMAAGMAKAHPTLHQSGAQLIEMMKTLGDLRKSGVLTEEEFQLQKSRILAAPSSDDQLLITAVTHPGEEFRRAEGETNTPKPAKHYPQNKTSTGLSTIAGLTLLTLAIFWFAGTDAPETTDVAQLNPAQSQDSQSNSASASGTSDLPPQGYSVSVPSDPKAHYTILHAEHTDAEHVTVTSRRDGPSGVSFAKRLVNCRQGTFKYLGDADTLGGLARATPEAAMGSLTGGSISTYISNAACRQFGL